MGYFRIWKGKSLSNEEVVELYSNREKIEWNFKKIPSYTYKNKSLIPSYSWEFRNNTGTSSVKDSIKGVVAQPVSGAKSTNEGMELHDVDNYVDITPFELGGAMTIEMYVKQDSIIGWDRLLEFGIKMAY